MSGTGSSAAARQASSTPAKTCDANAAWLELRRLTSEAYRPAGQFARRFARGKLRLDPVFRALVERGSIAPNARVLDIGCGQALLANLLCACDALAADNAWPREWAAAPAGTHYVGIELMPRDVTRARDSITSLPRTRSLPQVLCADMCRADLPTADVVVVLDVLHYVDHDAQIRLLQRVHAALPLGGRLLLRIGNASDRRRFAISQRVDRAVTRIRGHRAAAVFGRTLADWTALLQACGFAVEALPMSRGTPFANVLLDCRRVARPA
jgi:SAM-dependent methyltransferase